MVVVKWINVGYFFLRAIIFNLLRIVMLIGLDEYPVDRNLL